MNTFNPKRCILEVTYQCNLRCKTCAVWTERFRNNRLKTIQQLSFNQIKHIHHSLADYGIKRITYLGGEPFMRADLLDISAHAKKQGMSTAVVTNGTCINQADITRIIKKELFDSIIFSIDGPEHIHDSIRGVPGTFRRATETIKAIQKLKKKKKLKYPKIFMYTTVSASNYLYMETLLRIAQQLDVNSIRFLSASCLTKNIIERTNRIFKSKVIHCHNYEVPEKLKIPKNKLNSVRKTLHTLQSRSKLLGIKFQVEEFLISKKGTRDCGFLGNDFVISASGDIYPCPMLSNYRIGNIVREHMNEMQMHQHIKLLYELTRRKELPVCRECCVEKII